MPLTYHHNNTIRAKLTKSTLPQAFECLPQFVIGLGMFCLVVLRFYFLEGPLILWTLFRITFNKCFVPVFDILKFCLWLLGPDLDLGNKLMVPPTLFILMVVGCICILRFALWALPISLLNFIYIVYWRYTIHVIPVLLNSGCAILVLLVRIVYLTLLWCHKYFSIKDDSPLPPPFEYLIDPSWQ